MNNTPNISFTSLIIRPKGIDYLANSRLKSLQSLRNRMDKLTHFDLEVTKDGYYICPKETESKFGPKFELEEKTLPTGHDFCIVTNLQSNQINGDINLYLAYRNREEARRAYSNFREKDELGKVINLIEKMDYDAIKMVKEKNKAKH